MRGERVRWNANWTELPRKEQRKGEGEKGWYPDQKIDAVCQRTCMKVTGSRI